MVSVGGIAGVTTLAIREYQVSRARQSVSTGEASRMAVGAQLPRAAVRGAPKRTVPRPAGKVVAEPTRRFTRLSPGDAAAPRPTVVAIRPSRLSGIGVSPTASVRHPGPKVRVQVSIRQRRPAATASASSGPPRSPITPAQPLRPAQKPSASIPSAPASTSAAPRASAAPPSPPSPPPLAPSAASRPPQHPAPVSSPPPPAPSLPVTTTTTEGESGGDGGSGNGGKRGGGSSGKGGDSERD